jgi:hypothetical protein
VLSSAELPDLYSRFLAPAKQKKTQYVNQDRFIPHRNPSSFSMLSLSNSENEVPDPSTQLKNFQSIFEQHILSNASSQPNQPFAMY